MMAPQVRGKAHLLVMDKSNVSKVLIERDVTKCLFKKERNRNGKVEETHRLIDEHDGHDGSHERNRGFYEEVVGFAQAVLIEVELGMVDGEPIDEQVFVPFDGSHDDTRERNQGFNEEVVEFAQDALIKVQLELVDGELIDEQVFGVFDGGHDDTREWNRGFYEEVVGCVQAALIEVQRELFDGGLVDEQVKEMALRREIGEKQVEVVNSAQIMRSAREQYMTDTGEQPTEDKDRQEPMDREEEVSQRSAEEDEVMIGYETGNVKRIESAAQLVLEKRVYRGAWRKEIAEQIQEHGTLNAVVDGL